MPFVNLYVLLSQLWQEQIIKRVFLTTQVLNDEETDEFAAYFRCEVVPKVLITSSDRSKVVCLNMNTEF